MRAWPLLLVRAGFCVLSLFVVSCGGNADVPSAPSALADASPIATVEISELRVTAETTDVVVGATTTVAALPWASCWDDVAVFNPRQEGVDGVPGAQSSVSAEGVLARLRTNMRRVWTIGQLANEADGDQ